MKQHPETDAGKFLDLVDKTPELKAALRNLTEVRKLGEKYHLTFTNADLDKALQDKWGMPEKRDDGSHKVDPFTCCCI